ncbi:methylenetetrahydrofolate reductase [NAD(P)H], partial [Streptococcus gordonii]|nr:methylenetetrahydrofolate reductase [NAD(P)H] [Streptococcus gordonii]
LYTMNNAATAYHIYKATHALFNHNPSVQSF